MVMHTQLRHDLVVIGAGIVGLAHAWHAVNQGLRVVVIERDEYSIGASVRNFGHVCISAQAGLAAEYARHSRAEWLRLADLAGVNVRETGTLVVARSTEEEAVLHEFAAARNTDAHPSDIHLMEGDDVARRLGAPSHGIVSGALLTQDLRVDPLTALTRMVEHLRTVGVEFRFGVNVGTVEEGVVHTTHGQFHAPHIVVAVGHNVDRFFPLLADEYGIDRCRLRMLEIDTPRGVTIEPAVFTGLSLLRYDAFRELPASAALRERFEHEAPELLAHDLNHMLTQRPDGRLIIGDTHHRERTSPPFDDERSDELVLGETAQLFGVESFTIRKRWRGVYASSGQTNYLCETPLPGVRVASVTSGIGMTTAFGFARDSLIQLFNDTHSSPSLTPSTTRTTP